MTTQAFAPTSAMPGMTRPPERLSGRMADKPDANSPCEFRDGMRMMAHSVTVIAADHAGVRRGLTATAICSLSADPPMLAVCVNKSSSAYPTIAASSHFSVNCLTAHQSFIADAFAGRVTPEERFNQGDWQTGVTGAPILSGAIATFECELARIVDVSTHTLFIGLVLAVQNTEMATPLVYQDRNYKTFN